MDTSKLVQLRLELQRLGNPDFKTPADVVHWFGAMQAQDYLGSLWAVGQRMHASTETTIEKALADRTIVRSWPMRGTLHFTHAQDLHWMLKLLAQRVIKRSAFRYRELELTDETFKKSEKVFVKALMGGKEMTREELLHLLDKNTISPAGQRGIHILGKLAMEGLLCFGSRKGKQFTFTLLDEWIPHAKPKSTEEAIADLTKRYFTSHGPATVRDFAWWSGLTMAEIKQGIEMTKHSLHHETVEGNVYWFGIDQKSKKQKPKAWLLPAYDEYTVAYKDRSTIIASSNFIQAGNGLKPTIVLGGHIIGTWTRELKKHSVVVKPQFFSDITKTDRAMLDKAAVAYGNFLGREIELL